MQIKIHCKTDEECHRVVKAIGKAFPEVLPASNITFFTLSNGIPGVTIFALDDSETCRIRDFLLGWQTYRKWAEDELGSAVENLGITIDKFKWDFRVEPE